MNAPTTPNTQGIVLATLGDRCHQAIALAMIWSLL